MEPTRANPGIVTSLVRRAVDLARDTSVSSDEGAEHLQRLAMGRRDSLDEAIAHLAAVRDASPAVECAHGLLVRAVDRIDASAQVVSPSG